MLNPLILGIFDTRSYTSIYLKREAASCFVNCALLDEREQSRHRRSLANIDKPGVRTETVTDPTKLFFTFTHWIFTFTCKMLTM